MWSPDSQNIIYQASTEDGTSHLYGMNIQCLGKPQPCEFHELDLLSDQTTYDNPKWSPNGQSILFTQQDQGVTKIVVASLRCSDLSNICVNQYKVVGQGSQVRTPIWSPDSKSIAYIASTTTITVVQLTNGETHSFNTPGILPTLKDWSPDGRYIAYFSTNTGIFNVYLLDTFTGETYPLFAHQIANVLPEWRPTPH